MKATAQTTCEREYDFALITSGVEVLSQGVVDALYEAGCDDATLSMRYGLLYIDFSRTAGSLQEAILSAIRDVWKANVGAEVLRVDECNLVTPSEIARRIKRTRQLVFQYMHGQRGPGGFPPPECYLADRKPLWAWCAVSYWLVQNNIIPQEDCWDAEVVAAINLWLESQRQRKRHPELIKEINKGLQAS